MPQIIEAKNKNETLKLKITADPYKTYSKDQQIILSFKAENNNEEVRASVFNPTKEIEEIITKLNIGDCFTAIGNIAKCKLGKYPDTVYIKEIEAAEQTNNDDIPF